MKKIFLGILCAAIVLFTAACSQPSEKPIDSKSEASKSEVSKNEISLDGSEVSQQEFTETNLVYGKISSVTGNEISVSLAKDPYIQIPDGESSVEGGDSGATVAAGVIMAPAAEKGEGIDVAPKMELEYTGETEDYIVPAGVKIIGTNGAEEQLSALKKGSVLMLIKNVETDAVTDIMILE